MLSIGAIIAVIPMTPSISKIFDPIKLPIEIPFSLLSIATIEVDSSGILPIFYTDRFQNLNIT